MNKPQNKELVNLLQAELSGRPVTWQQVEPIFQQLTSKNLTQDNLEDWLQRWSDISRLVEEIYQRSYVAITTDTTDLAASQRYETFLDELHPKVQAAHQQLKEKFLACGMEPVGMKIPMRNMRAEAAIFRSENLELFSEELKLISEYDRLIGAQSISLDGEEKTIVQLQTIYDAPNRAKRETAWCKASVRQLADRDALNQLWTRLLAVRKEIAKNARFPDFRAYRWQQLLRFDYSPQDCATFHQAIEQVVVPAAVRIYEKRRQRMGVPSLRPWDLSVDPLGRPPLRPFQQVEDLVEKTGIIFTKIDPQLGQYFQTLRQEGLLDLVNRKGKAPGGYCTAYDFARRAFIFMNAVGIHDDVLTLLHEGGHAFHVFESAVLPYHSQLQVGMEFGEVASTAMEYLGAPYLADEDAGFYTPAEAARSRAEHLASQLLFLPYMAVVDAFQHWVYENQEAASHPANCDAQWDSLWQRFMKGQDWSDFEEERRTGWQRKPHIFEVPFYYIEYGIAGLGAIQVWRNALQNQARAVTAYRKALALGGTASLPELYKAADIRFAFDESFLKGIVELIEATIDDLEEQAAGGSA
jgi:oligoendopeptidase F